MRTEAGAKIERRILERTSTVLEVLAPASWSDARVEAWIEFVGGEPDLPAGLFKYAESLVQRGEALGLFESVTARSAFRRDLGAAMLAGQIAISEPKAGARLALTKAGAAECVGALSTLRAEHRGRAMARASVRELSRRLQAVMDAVLRCEGDPAACADPQSNASLARAAEAARAAGAGDELILDAIALARAGEDQWTAAAPVFEDVDGLELACVAPLDLDLAPAATLAAVAWETGAVATAFQEQSASDLAQSWGGARGALKIGRAHV